MQLRFLLISALVLLAGSALAFPLAFAAGLLGRFAAILPHGFFEFAAFFSIAVGGGLFSVTLEHTHAKGVFPRLALQLVEIVFSPVFCCLWAHSSKARTERSR